MEYSKQYNDHNGIGHPGSTPHDNVEDRCECVPCRVEDSRLDPDDREVVEFATEHPESPIAKLCAQKVAENNAAIAANAAKAVAAQQSAIDAAVQKAIADQVAAAVAKATATAPPQ